MPRLGDRPVQPREQRVERPRRDQRLAEFPERVRVRHGVAGAEEAVKTVEAEMASPGFYDDRERALVAAERHQKLMWETGDLISQWEALQAEVDRRAERLAEITPSPAGRATR